MVKFESLNLSLPKGESKKNNNILRFAYYQDKKGQNELSSASVQQLLSEWPQNHLAQHDKQYNRILFLNSFHLDHLDHLDRFFILERFPQ